MPVSCMTPVPPQPQPGSAFTSPARLAPAALAQSVTPAQLSAERGTREGGR